MKTRLAALLVVAAVAAAAQQHPAVPARPETEGARPTRQIVLGVAPHDGGRYLSTFVPERRSEVYITDAAPSVITVNMTDVYYWPISAEYRADFQGVNLPLPGELRILRGGQLVGTYGQTEYIYVYPLGLEGEATRLAQGEEMKRLIEERARAVADYQAGRAAQPPRFAYQGPFRGFVVSLPAGRYRLEYRIENQGRIFTLGKSLEVFSPLRRGTRYQIIPEQKWTVSSDSDSPHKRIYLRTGEVVYFKTFPALLYNAAKYDLMAFPNRPTAGLGLASSVVWVAAEESLEERPDASLEIRAAGRTVATPPRDYLVVQTPGSALGYDIVEHSLQAFAGTRPSFRAYRIVAPPPGYDVSLRAGQGPGASRSLRSVDTDASAWCALALALPLALGAARLVVGGAGRRALQRPGLRA